MRRSPTRSPRASTWHVASTRSHTRICGTPVTAICVGGPMARYGNSISSIRNSGKKQPVAGPSGTIGASVEHLDLATVIKISQAVSGEIVLDNLIDVLLRTAIRHAGAERGLLLLPQGASFGSRPKRAPAQGAVTVRLRESAATGLPEAVVQYAARTREPVILDDASAGGPFSGDEYVRRHRARSILCLPLDQAGPTGGAALPREQPRRPRVHTRADRGVETCSRPRRRCLSRTAASTANSRSGRRRSAAWWMPISSAC